MVLICNQNTCDVGNEEGVQGHSHLYTKLEACMGYLSLAQLSPYRTPTPQKDKNTGKCIKICHNETCNLNNYCPYFGIFSFLCIDFCLVLHIAGPMLLDLSNLIYILALIFCSFQYIYQASITCLHISKARMLRLYIGSVSSSSPPHSLR